MHRLHKSGSTNSSGASSFSNSFNDGSGPSKSKNGSSFLCPPPTGSLDILDKGSLLLNTLNILYSLRALELEKEKNDKGKVKNAGNKKDPKSEIEAKSYEFTKDMFHFINMEAFLQVTHFLFEVYDSKETEQRFRNTWPIYDKKMEGIYRRVVLDWLKEIVEKFPRFFRGLKIEAIGGLIVNPGGERFLKLIHSFSTFILHQVCDRKRQQGYVIEPIYDYFESFSQTPSQVKNKQIYLLQNASNQLIKQTFESQKKLVKSTLQHKKLMEELQNRKHTNDSQFEDSKLELYKKIQNNPELFPKDAKVLLEKRKSYTTKISSFDQLFSGNVAPDPLCKVIKEKIEESSAEAIEKLNDIKKFFDHHERLWLFLHIDRTNPVVLDGSKLFKPRNMDGEYSSLNRFIAAAAAMINRFSQKDDIWKATDPVIVEKCISLKQRHQFLKLRANDLRKTDGDLELYKKNLDFESKVLSMKLNEIDWRFLSNSDNFHSMNTMLTLTPARMFDVNRTTGYTPAINMFLSHSSKEISVTPSRFPSEFRHTNSQRPDGEAKLKTSLREYSLTKAASTKMNGLSKLFPSDSVRFNNQNQCVVDSALLPLSPINNINGFSPLPSAIRKPQQELVRMNITPIGLRESSQERQIGPAGDCPHSNLNTSQYKISTSENMAEARISRLLDSLRDSPVNNCHNEETKDSFKEKEHEHLTNSSIVDDWENEKGLMDMSMSNVSFLNDDNF